MLRQRVIFGIGLAVLLIISAASISLDLKSRADAAWVTQTFEVLNKISDVRLLVRRAESSARGFGLSGATDFTTEFQEARERIGPAFAELRRKLGDNPKQLKLLDRAKTLVARRLDVSAELIERKQAGDTDGINTMFAKAAGRALMQQLAENFDGMIAEEERLLTIRTAGSQQTGMILISIDLAGASLILLLVVFLIREGRQLKTSLSASEAAKESLEAAVAERTKHLSAAHEGLRRSESVLKNTFQSMAEAVLVIDPRGEVLLSNPAAEKMLRYKHGMNVQSLRSQGIVFHADGTTPMQPEEMPTARVLRGEEFDEQEIVVRPLRGHQMHFVISGRPIREESGAISAAALVYHDITGSRDTERRLREAQKLEAIGKLTGGVAHDFNNMLTVITGTTETLVNHLKERPDLCAVARLIDDASERCAELIKHLLAFARKQPLQPRNVDLNKAVADIARLLRPTLGGQIEIATILTKDVMPVHIDASQLANAVVNMAINARDAMPNGGKLLLETCNAVLDEAYVAANPDAQAGHYVMLAISDTGTGMPPEVLEHVFEPFFTTKEVGKGTGLGLSMVYGFVKQSGGHINIYSEEGVGTTIRLYLPPAQGRIDAIAEAGAEAAAGGSETILVVEDDTLVRGFVVAQLNDLGYKTISAKDSREAIALVDRGEPFDLLFTDVIMPGGMSGRELAAIVAKRRPGVRVLYTSGYTDNAVMHHGRLDEGVLLLTKPYRKPQLAQMLRQALDRTAVTTS